MAMVVPGPAGPPHPPQLTISTGLVAGLGSAAAASVKSPASADGSGPPTSTTSDTSRALNVKDALSYLDQVKFQFGDQPTVYNRFLDIMKDFKSQTIDTPGVIDRVAALFRGHPSLIMGFNTFLPPGYRIESTNNPGDPIRVITPHTAAPYAPRPVEFGSGGVVVGPGGSIAGGMGMVMGPGGPIAGPPGPMVGGYPAPPPPPIGVPAASFYSQGSVAPHAPGMVGMPGHPPAMAQASCGPYPPPHALHGSAGMSEQPMAQVPASSAPTAPPAAAGDRRAPVEFNHAINYVNKIKTRFAREPETYKEFLEILQTYQKEQKPIHDVYAQVQGLFGNAPDLLEEFKQFLPDTSSQAGRGVPAGARGAPAGAPKPKRMATAAPAPPSAAAQQPPPKKKSKTSGGAVGASSTGAEAYSAAEANRAGASGGGNVEELEFFDKCKKAIGNKATYNEFLKVLNLFSQEIIEAKILVERVAPYLAKAPELLDWFKNFVKYEEEEVIYNVPAERHEFDMKTCRRSGHSYRMMPVHIPRSVASGRNDLCRSVLNDDWLSHPIFISETGFVAHRKNAFEEALFKCEEERYEFDRNIEANLHTIALLEPIAHRLLSMSAEEKTEFKLLPGLGGISKTIYQRVIKSIYDRDRGQEVIDALHENPAVAVPVVLKRLKQKDEEWKRAQREWNKVWKDIDHKNFYKALDHQGITFKMTDRKSVNLKSLVTEIETLAREQKELGILAGGGCGNGGNANCIGSTNGSTSRLASTRTPSPRPGAVSSSTGPWGSRYQLDFAFKDAALFRDVRRILQSAVDTSVSLTAADEERVNEGLVKTFLVTFFFLDEASYKAKFPEGADIVAAGPPPAGAESKVSPPRPAYPFYANTLFYSFFRIYQMIYSRLLKMKELSRQMARVPARHETLNPLAVELGLQKSAAPDFNEADRYSDLFRNIVLFVSGDVEAVEFEDSARSMFGTSAYLVFTLDKLAQAAIKVLQQISADPKSMELMALYYKDRAKVATSSRQEAVYRLSAEALTQEENTFRLEYERTLTMQILRQEDYILDDYISSEEKWSLYVDHFVQLSKESVVLKRKEPFLSRNLPKDIGDEMPKNVFTYSGLELKICVNTYKIFFVDDTEDFFFRRRPATLGADWTAPSGYVPRRSLTALLADPKRGWTVGLADPTAAAARLELAFVGAPGDSGKGQLVAHSRPGYRVFWRS